MDQMNARTVEEPCHQHFDNQEHDDCCNIILYGHYIRKHLGISVGNDCLTYIVSMLCVEKSPEAGGH